MNVVNRVIVSVLCVVLIVVLAVAVFVALAMPEAGIDYLAGTLSSLKESLNFVNRLIFSGVAVLVLLLVLIVLWMEIRRPPARAIEVQEITVGEARVTIESIVQRLEHNIGRLQDVVGVRPEVTERRGGVDVKLHVQTAPEIDVPMKTEEVVQLTREVIEEQMGLKLQRVSVEIKHAPYSEDDLL